MMSTVTRPLFAGGAVSANRPFPRASRSARCGHLHSEAIAMHPQYHLDLHHDRARSLQREAHQRRLLAEAARQPSNEAQDLLTLADLLATGQVTPVIDRTYPLDEAADALRYVGAGHTRGKVVVTV